MEEALIPTVVTVEEQINQELVKANVTEAIIASLKEKYLPLKIAGIEDKETYLQVKDARKECKAVRILAEKICKKGREEGVAIQKAWVAKEKDVAGRIGEVEDYLEKQEKEYEAQVSAEKERRKREQDEQFIHRQSVLTKMGVLYADGHFTLGEVSFEMSLIKECEPYIWEESILPKYHEAFDIINAERKAEAEKKLAEEAELKRQQEEVDRKRRELEEREAAILKAEEDARIAEQNRLKEEERLRLQREAEAKAAKAREDEARWRKRLDELVNIGWNGQYAFPRHHDDSIRIATHQQLVELNEEEWVILRDDYNASTNRFLEELEVKKQQELEEQKRIAAENAAKAERERIEREQAAAELKRQQEEQRKAEEMAQAGDKEKWNDVLSQLNKLDIHEMRSGQYRRKAAILREKLEEIKAL